MAKTSIDFIERDRGPEGWRALTIELESDYLEEFYEALKDNLPYGAWRYSPEHKSWFILPRWRDVAAGIALKHFERVWLVRGSTRVDFRSGETFEQGTMFG
jgi:hypothetical protein